ncbi:MAG: tetratricopeptide repeat protein [Bacteroidota bacterium]
MHQFSDDNENIPLSKFELMLKTNSVYFFDSNEFEEIILYYIDNGKLSLANKALQLGLTQHPMSVGLRLIKVELLILEEKLESAELILDQLQEFEPSNDEVYIQKATIFSKKGLHKKAIEALKKALQYTDDDVEIYSMIGMEYLFLDDFDTARLNFAKCLDVEYDNYSSLYNVIYCFDMLDQHNEAVNYLVKHIDKDPYSEVAWHQLGRQYYLIENYEKALEAFDYAILVDETFIGAHLEKAKTLEKLKYFQEAIDYYNATMDLDTPTPFAYLRIGKCYEQLNEPKLALEYYNKTVNEDPLLDKGWLAITDIYIKNSEYQQALYYIRKALGIDEENIEYWNKLAEINLKLNLFDEAVKAYQKSIDLEDDRLDVYIALADVLHFLENNYKAIEVLNKANKKYKDHAEIIYRLACLNYLMQDQNEAFFLLEKSLKLNFEYHHIIKNIFPSIFLDQQIISLIEKFKKD